MTRRGPGSGTGSVISRLTFLSIVVLLVGVPPRDTQVACQWFRRCRTSASPEKIPAVSNGVRVVTMLSIVGPQAAKRGRGEGDGAGQSDKNEPARPRAGPAIRARRQARTPSQP